MSSRSVGWAEVLERRLFLAGTNDPPDLTPLFIPNLVFENGVFTATNPTISVNGTPTVSLQGTVTVGNGQIQAEGQVRAAFGNNQLLFGGNFTIPIGNAATSALADTLGDVADRLKLAGTKLTFANLALAAGSVQFDATAKLPPALGSYELSATQVSFGASGISAATLGIADPAVYQLDLGGFRLNAQNLSATYEVQQQRVKFTGLFNAPQLSTTVDFSGNRFIAVGDGPTIEFAGGVSINGPVTIGGPWKLQSLDLQISYQNDTFTTSGEGVLDTGGGNLNLEAQFQNSTFSFSATGGATFNVLGMQFTLSGLTFTSDQSGGGSWDPKVEVQGSLKLPQQFGDFTVAVQDPNKLVIDSSGVSLSGAELSLPGNQTFTVLNLIELKTQNATLSFDFAQSEMKLQGTYTIPTLNNLQINLSGNNFAALKFDKGLDFAMQGTFSNINIPIFGAWQLQNGSVTINKPYGVVPGDISGSFQIKTPNNTTISLSLAFQNGRLTQVTATNNNPNPDFTFFGVSGRITSLKFIPDINPGNDDDFEPQLELQGSMSFPTSFGTVTGGGGGPVTFSVADPEKFILNESGLTLTGGSISIPSINFNLLNVVKVSAQSLKVQYISTPTASLRVSGIVKIPQLYNLELNFNPAQNRFIQFDSSGNVSVNGVVSVSNVVIVPNLWIIRNASFAFNNTGQQNIFEVNATLQIPSGAQVGGKIKFVGGDLDAINLFGENLRIPLGATGVFLQRIEGGLQNLNNPTGNPPLRFNGGMGLSFGPRIDIDLPSIVGGGTLTGSLVDLTVTGTIDRNSLTVNGDVAIVGNSRPAPPSGLITGTAGLVLNWSRGTFQGNWDVSILGGLFSANVDIQANSQGTLGFTGVGTGQLPSGFPFYSLQLPSASGALYFTNNDDYSDDFVACWGSVEIFNPFGANYIVTKGIKVFFDGNFQIINSEVILPPILTNEERAEYNINAGTAKYVVTADWTNRTVAPQQVRVQFFDPNTSQLIDVTTPGNGIVNSVAIGQLQNGNRTFVLNGVQRTGRYVFTLVPPAGQQFNNTQWTGGIPNEKPQINITSAPVAANLSNVTINYTALDPDNQAKITFFIDTDNVGFNGTAIRVYRNNVAGFEVPELDMADSVLWRSAEPVGPSHYITPSGTYFIYARIDDGSNAPVFRYFNTPVQIDTNANPHIIRMYVGSTRWTESFKNALAQRELGGEDGFLIYAADLTPTRPSLPWANIDRLVVQFNQAVDLPEGAVTLTGPGGIPISVENDVANARYIITLDNFQVTGVFAQYLLTLAETITSVFDELPLDGNNDRTPGDAALRPYLSLPGDVDGSRSVNIADFATFAAAFFTSPTVFPSAYNPLADFDGNGAINIVDFALLAKNFGITLRPGTSGMLAAASDPPTRVAPPPPFSRRPVLDAEDPRLLDLIDGRIS